MILAASVLLGCGERDESDLAEDAKPVLSLEVTGVFRDSVAAAFLRAPDSVLSRLDPAFSPEDVRAAAALLEVSKGEAKLRFVHYLIDQDVRSIPALISVVERSEDWNTLVAAIQALGKLEAVDAIDAIAAHLRSPNDWVRMTAAHALGSVGGKASVKALVPALKDSVDTVVSAALIAMGKAGDHQMVHLCVPMLEHVNPRVRAAAVSAIGRIGRVEDLPVLETRVTDTDPGVRFKAEQAIERIKSGVSR